MMFYHRNGQGLGKRNTKNDGPSETKKQKTCGENGGDLPNWCVRRKGGRGEHKSKHEKKPGDGHQWAALPTGQSERRRKKLKVGGMKTNRGQKNAPQKHNSLVV